MEIVKNPDGRPRLLDLIDQTDDGLRSVMDFNVVYSLADRTCQRCSEGRRADRESVALVKVPHAGHPFGHLITLCAEHAEQWRPASDA